MLDRIRHSLGLNRYTVETPVSQHQQSANTRDSGVRPAALPQRGTPSNTTEMAPGIGLPATGANASAHPTLAAWAAGASPSASPLTAVTPSPARSETALVATQVDSAEADTTVAAVHPLIGAMKQGSADRSRTSSAKSTRSCSPRRCFERRCRRSAPSRPTPHRWGCPAPTVLLAQSLALVGDIAAAWQQHELQAADRPDEVDAWRVAMELGTTPSGMKVLQVVFAKPIAPD